MMFFLYPLIGAYFFYRRANAVFKFAPGYAILGYILSFILIRLAVYCNTHFIRDTLFSILLFWTAIILSAALPYFIIKPKAKSTSFKELD
jgi:hypothetical protein